jgi:hypothetical protein
MPPNQRKNQQKIVMELHPSEAELIDRIRHRFKYGKIEVLCKDGLPVAIEKTVERFSLNI